MAFVFATALFLSADSVADPDLWGHVLFGRLILDGGLPRTDPYSYLSGGHPWINHEWLSEIGFAGAYGWIGPAGLIGLKAVLGCLIAAALWVHLRRRGLDAVAGVVLVLAFALVRVGLSTVRPHLFTYAFLAALLLVLDGVDRGRRAWIWALPPLMAAWTNFHGGVLAGIGVIGLWSGGHVVQAALRSRGDGPGRKELVRRGLVPAAAVGLALLAPLASPYGWRLPAFLLRTGTVARPEIVEWQPVEFLSGAGALYLVFTAFLVFALIGSRAPGGFPGSPSSGSRRSSCCWPCATFPSTASRWRSSRPITSPRP